MLKKAMLFCVLILFIPALVLGELIDNGDGTVTDTSTGLMWVNSADVLTSVDGLDWEGANLAADALVYPTYPTETEPPVPPTYSDWRLPSSKELVSIMDYSKGSSAMNTVFKNVKATYWSSTSYWEIVEDTAGKDVTVWSLAWYVNTADGSIATKRKYVFNEGTADKPVYKAEKCYVIAVRGGQNQLVLDNGYIASPTIDSDWYANGVVPILWTAGKAIKGDVTISLSKDMGKTFTEVIAAGTSNDGTYMWTPTDACENCFIKISAADGTTAGSTVQGPFSIGEGGDSGGVKGDYNGNDKLDLGDGVGILKELTQ